MTFMQSLPQNHYDVLAEFASQSGKSLDQHEVMALSPSEQRVLTHLKEGELLGDDDLGWAQQLSLWGLTVQVEGKFVLTAYGHRIADLLG